MNDILISYPVNDYRNYLQHHGILGQKRGVRRAPWYPIAAYEAHLARTGGKAKDNYSTHNSSRVRVTQGGAAYDAFSKRMERLRIQDVEEHVEKAKNAHEKEKYEKKLNELLKKANDKKKGRELTKKEWNLVRKQDPDTKLEEQKRAVAEVEREEREHKKYLEDNKDTILQKGTMEEILELAGIADNSRLAQAINNRHTLDQALRSVEVKKKWEKFEPLLENAQKAAEVAGTISNLVNKGYGAYKDVNTALKGLGIISDKKSDKESNLDNLFKGKNATEISNKVYEAAVAGKISDKELKSANDRLKNLFDLESKAGKDRKTLKEAEAARQKEFEKSQKLIQEAKDLDKKVKAQNEQDIFEADQKISKLTSNDIDKETARISANRDKEEKERREAINKQLDEALKITVPKQNSTQAQPTPKTSTQSSNQPSSGILANLAPQPTQHNLAKKLRDTSPAIVEEFNNVVAKYGRKKYESPKDALRQYVTDELTNIFNSSKQYKNSEHVREIAAKVREDGYSSLTPSEKATYNKFYLK